MVGGMFGDGEPSPNTPPLTIAPQPAQYKYNPPPFGGRQDSGIQ